MVDLENINNSGPRLNGLEVISLNRDLLKPLLHQIVKYRENTRSGDGSTYIGVLDDYNDYFICLWPCCEIEQSKRNDPSRLREIIHHIESTDGKPLESLKIFGKDLMGKMELAISTQPAKSPRDLQYNR